MIHNRKEVLNKMKEVFQNKWNQKEYKCEIVTTHAPVVAVCECLKMLAVQEIFTLKGQDIIKEYKDIFAPIPPGQITIRCLLQD